MKIIILLYKSAYFIVNELFFQLIFWLELAEKWIFYIKNFESSFCFMKPLY
jgi:hypothetical protein